MAEYFKTEKDILKREELHNLMLDWKKLISTKSKIVFPDDEKEYPAIEYFNTDGFFPGYYSEDIKILFIGRESRYSSGGDRIVSDLDWFSNGSPNASSYWRRILYLVYGIRNKGKYSYSDIPYANEILDRMKKENKYGFAIMNISKYANEAEDGANANYELINQFLIDSELSKRNFIREEIEILEPDVIITANLWNSYINKHELMKVFPDKDFHNARSKDYVANLYDFKMGNRIIKLLDLYHFSNRGSDKSMFYNPCMELLFNDK